MRSCSVLAATRERRTAARYWGMTSTRRILISMFIRSDSGMPADPPAVRCSIAANKRCRIGAESYRAQQCAPCKYFILSVSARDTHWIMSELLTSASTFSQALIRDTVDARRRDRRLDFVLTRFHVVRFAGPYTLLLVGGLVTTAIFLWTHQMRLTGNTHGLAPSFFVLFACQDYPGSVWALLILAGAFFGSRYFAARPTAHWVGDHPCIITVTAGLLLALGTLVVYHNHPLSMDEYAAYFQSRAFAAGRLGGRFPVPPLNWLIPPGFQDYFLNVSGVTGRVAEAYWPGFALLLAPFMWASVPWLCNPVLSALTLLVIYRLALELFVDCRAAG